MSALNPVYTVGEQISEALNHLTDLNVEKKNKKVLELLELTGIDEPPEGPNVILTNCLVDRDNVFLFQWRWLVSLTLNCR